jgi:hypothetical protein
LAAIALAGLVLSDCGGDEANPVWKALCEASCTRAFECFPEEGSISECVSECLSGAGNEPCDRNQDALNACVAGIAMLSCEAFETGPLPFECRFVCTGGGLCEDPTCDDGNACTVDACDPATGGCIGTPVVDGIPCPIGMNGMCVEGRCAGVFPCNEQGLLDAIAAGGGPHTFDCNIPTTITTEAEIVIQNEVILDGENNLEVNGNNSHRVFSVANTPGGFSLEPVVELRRLTISGGRAVRGGGISNEATLTLVDSTVSGNTAIALGGGIYNDETMTLMNTTVSNNTAEVEGGGIFNQFERTLTLDNSTVSGNQVDGLETCDGGGIRNGGGTLLLINSTLSANAARGGRVCEGGGLHNSGTATLTNSTVANNEADIGSGVFFRHGEATLTNTLLDGDCEAGSSFALASNGHNIESPRDTCGLDDVTDQTGVSAGDLDLQPLADYGGPTFTHALGPDSVAIDQISIAACVDADGEPLTEDQRGVARPQGPACDVGAFESEQ